MKLQSPSIRLSARYGWSGAWRLRFFWCLVLGAWSCCGRAADTNAVLDGWMAAQTNLQTWHAEFTQTRTLKTLTRPLVATGRLWFATPNRFRWELQSPSQTIALRATNEMWVVYPRLKRAERYPMEGGAAGEWKDALALLEAGFPRSRTEFEARFQLLSLSENDGAWQLQLRPSGAFAQKMMREIIVGLSTNDYSLVFNEMVFVDGSRMRNDFTNGVMNSGFDLSVFEWRRDPDYKITEPLGP